MNFKFNRVIFTFQGWDDAQLRHPQTASPPLCQSPAAWIAPRWKCQISSESYLTWTSRLLLMCFLNFIENPEGAGFFGHSNSVVCNLQVPKLISNLLAWPNTHQMFSQPFVLFVFSMISPCTRLDQKDHFFIRLVHLNQVGLVVHIIHLIEASTENCWISSTPGWLAFPHTAAAPPRWRWCPRLWTWYICDLQNVYKI